MCTCEPSLLSAAKSISRLSGIRKCCLCKSRELSRKCGRKWVNDKKVLIRTNTHSSSTAANVSLLLVTSTLMNRIFFFSPVSDCVVWWTLRNKLLVEQLINAICGRVRHFNCAHPFSSRLKFNVFFTTPNIVFYSKLDKYLKDKVIFHAELINLGRNQLWLQNSLSAF